MKVPILRHILRYILTIETKLVIKKHKPYIVAILGEKDSTYIREVIYAIVREEYNVRRNLEKTNSEFSIPLTVFGKLNYPKHSIDWLKIIIKTLAQIIYVKPYKHHLVLQLHEIESYILLHWLKVLSPNLIVNAESVLESDISEIINNSNIIILTSKDIESIKQNSNDKVLISKIQKLSKELKIPPNKIIKTIRNFEMTNPRIRIIKGKNKNLIIDARYYYYPISTKAICEITNLMPQKKYVVTNTSNLDYPKDYKIIKESEIDFDTANSIFIFVDSKFNQIKSMQKLALNELEI